MNRSARKYPRRPQLDDRIEVAVTSELKGKVYDAAASMGIPAAEFIRQAIASVIAGAA